MRLTRQSTRTCLRLLGTALSAVLLATPAIRAQAANCATMAAASSKMLDVPYHAYMLDSAGTALDGGKPTLGEVISAEGWMYVLVNGKWVKSPVSLAEIKNSQKDNPDSTKTKYTCSHLRDESVNGEPAAVWQTRIVNDMATIDSDIWISKSRGVPLKANILTDVGGPMGKSRSIARYDYANVRAPAGVP